MAHIRPYHISFSASEIDVLRQKLALSRLPDHGYDSWERGTPPEDIRRFCDYWHRSFSFESFQARLNRLPNFEATISVDGYDALQVHFLHQKSSSKDAIPLLFIHGWPGSYYEATKILPLLAESEKNGGPAFHVIAPSLPNFGFSSRVDKPGFGLKHYAETCHKLMLALGYDQYVVQGGDWGSSVGLTMGSFYPQSLRALHLNLIAGSPPSPKSPIAFLIFLIMFLFKLYSDREAAGLQAARRFREHGNGYFVIAKQRPNTIGIALADSPAALLAWIYDKLVVWTDSYQWTEEEVCEWVSLYWFSRSGPAASIVIYHETSKGSWPMRPGIPAPGVKLGLSYFPKEFYRTPASWNRRLGKVVFEREHDSGGHFAAWERPEDLVGDLRVMFGPGGGAYGAVNLNSTTR